MKKYLLIIAVFFATGISSCKKDFLSLEVNPNTPSVTTPQFTLSGALKIAADIVNTNYSHYGVWAGYWTSSGNYVPSPQLQQYQFTTDNYQVFTGLYQNLTNFNNLETLGAQAGNAKFQAIAKIMKAYDFEQLVDYYNDVPYSQAFNATKYLFPKYDKGQDIYNDLVKQLVAAIGIINSSASATNPGVSDIMFGGDMAKWKKFANTLLLRMALRQSKLGGGTAKTAVASLTAADFIDDTFAATLNPGYANSDSNGGQESPFWKIYGFDQSGNPTGNSLYYRANQFAVDLLNKFTDPRISKFYALSGGSVKGIVFGDPNAAANASTSAIGPGLLSDPTMDANILSSAESLFLQAEAVQLGWIGGNAKDLYQKGITASFVSLGLSTTQASDYYNQAGVADVNWDSSPNKLEAIGTQKWISLNGYANLEGFIEFKRTGFPIGVPRSIDSKAIGTGIPNRVFYPTSEYQQNAASVGAEGTIDPFSSKIFWQ